MSRFAKYRWKKCENCSGKYAAKDCYWQPCCCRACLNKVMKDRAVQLSKWWKEANRRKELWNS